MASVQELLLAAEAKKSPFISMMEGAAQGFGNAHDGALERAMRLIQIDNMRQEQERQAKLQMEMDNESNLRQRLGQLDEKGGVTPQQKIVRYEEGPRGITKTVEDPSSKQPRGLDAVLAERVLSGELSIEDAYKLKAQGSPSSQPKAPTGFRWSNDGNLEAIPGGPADIKIQDKNRKFLETKKGFIRKTDLVLSTIQRARDKAGAFTTGMGSLLSSVPGSGARDMKELVGTIQANVGFQELQDMRSNSPTGGALGQVSDMENRLLQATKGALDTGQSKEQFLKNIKILEDLMLEIKTAAEKDAEALTSGKPIKPEAQKSPNPKPEGGLKVGDIENGYRYKGGDPSEPGSWEEVK